MEWIKKHSDTFLVLGALFGGFLWLNSQFNEIRKDITIIKTVMIMKGIMPENLAMNKGEK
jgi:hypothetical protein